MDICPIVFPRPSSTTVSSSFVEKSKTSVQNERKKIHSVVDSCGGIEKGPLFLPFPSESSTMILAPSKQGKSRLLKNFLVHADLYFEKPIRQVIILNHNKNVSFYDLNEPLDENEEILPPLGSKRPLVREYLLDDFDLVHEELSLGGGENTLEEEEGREETAKTIGIHDTVIVFEDLQYVTNQVLVSLNTLCHHRALAHIFIISQSILGTSLFQLLSLTHRVILFLQSRSIGRLAHYICQTFFHCNDTRQQLKSILSHAEKSQSIFQLELNVVGRLRPEDQARYLAIENPQGLYLKRLGYCYVYPLELFYDSYRQHTLFSWAKRNLMSVEFFASDHHTQNFSKQKRHRQAEPTSSSPPSPTWSSTSSSISSSPVSSPSRQASPLQTGFNEQHLSALEKTLTNIHQNKPAAATLLAHHSAANYSSSSDSEELSKELTASRPAKAKTSLPLKPTYFILFHPSQLAKCLRLIQDTKGQQRKDQRNLGQDWPTNEEDSTAKSQQVERHRILTQLQEDLCHFLKQDRHRTACILAQEILRNPDFCISQDGRQIKLHHQPDSEAVNLIDFISTAVRLVGPSETINSKEYQQFHALAQSLITQRQAPKTLFRNKLLLQPRFSTQTVASKKNLLTSTRQKGRKKSTVDFLQSSTRIPSNSLKLLQTPLPPPPSTLPPHHSYYDSYHQFHPPYYSTLGENNQQQQQQQQPQQHSYLPSTYYNY